jgi:phospholipid/cholesterol/gamma-HCH transport system substrate-binding protein
MKNKEFRVGLFIAVALVMLYFGFNFLKGIDFLSSTKKYYAVYDNVDQLAVSNQVFLNGYAVGRVSKIKILQHRHNLVLVEFDIDSDIVMGDSTKAILNSDFLGGKSVLLAVKRVHKNLVPGDTLRAEVAKGMLDIFTQTAEPVADNLQTTLRKFNTVLDNLAHNSQQLDTILRRTQMTPVLLNKTLATTNTQIGDLSEKFKLVADNLNGSLTELKPAMANFKTLSDSLKHIQINQTLHKMQTLLTTLNESASKLKKHDNTMGRLLTEDSLYVNLNKMLVTLNELSGNFNSNPKHFLAPLGKSKSKIDRDRKKEAAEKKAAAAQKK